MEHDGKNATRYHIEDIEKLDANDSHSIILKFIEHCKLVLDVGCSTGSLGKALRERNIRSVGMEFDSEAAEKARPYYEKVIVGDVTSQDILNQIENKSFDAVVLGDVVEHLTDPWSFVKEVAKKIADEGDLIISIPNLGHASVIAALLSGSFQYRDMGLLDHTHYRFFGIQSLCSMLMDAGLTPVELKRVRHNTFSTEIPVHTEHLPTELFTVLDRCPESGTYQFVIKARNTSPQEDLTYYVNQFALPVVAAKSREDELASYVKGLENKRKELREAHEYINRCHDTIKEKDTLIEKVNTERSELEEKCSDLRHELEFIKPESNKLQRQLSVQLQKTREMNFLLERWRSRAKTGEEDKENIDSDRVLDIIIPVYNSYDEVRACLTSVLKHTQCRHRIYITDDASTDRRIVPYLKSLAQRYDQIHLVMNETNRGWIRTVNSALTDSDRDVIVLNSDTIVTARWIEKLMAAARSDEHAGMVCPLSNNATIMSVPNMNENNDIPVGMSIDRFGQLVEEVSAKSYLTIPTVVGFCTYIKRECINAVGLWDESFGMGYGEENDFAMRARTKGYVCKVADDTFVFHSGSTSFKTASGDLDERKISNERLLKQRWPEYHKEIFAFCIINPLREIQQRIHDGISRWVAGDKPHIMQVLHSYEADAGTELHTKHLATELKEFFRYTLFFPGNEISDSEAKSYVSKDSIMELRYASRNMASDIYFSNIPSSLRSGVVETNFERILRSSDIKIVHFQHMLNYGTFKLPFIAKSLGLKVALTLHDYFYICPVFNLLKVDHTMCHKIIPDGKDEECMNCFSGNLQLENQETNTHNIKVYMAQRHEAVMDALKAADVIISPSIYVKNKMSLSFGKSIGDKIRVIPHGVEIPEHVSVPIENKKLVVNFLGNATLIKGFDVFGQAAIRLKKKALFTQNGSGQRELLDKYRRHVRLKGPYKQKDLAEIFKRTDLVVIPSIWEETFCYTLSEAMAYGVPVIASDAGALSERVVQGKNGYLFPVGDVDALVEIIEKLHRDPEHVREMKQYCRNNTPASSADMWEIYRTLYDDLLNERISEKDMSSEGACEHAGKEVKV